MITTTTAVFYSISKGVVATLRKIHPLLFLCPMIGIAGVNMFVALTMLFPDNRILVLVLNIVRMLTGICYFTVQIYWFYSAWKHYRTQKQFGVEETKELTYMFGESFFFVYIVLLAKGNNVSNFLALDESFLIMYYIIISLFSVFMTVLPGRLLRKICGGGSCFSALISSGRKWFRVYARVAVANTLAVDRSAKEKKYPIEQLEDDSVNKTITGFLRFEVVDSGAGSIICHHIILSRYI
eukprot:gene28626-37830_t